MGVGEPAGSLECCWCSAGVAFSRTVQVKTCTAFQALPSRTKCAVPRAAEAWTSSFSLAVQSEAMVFFAALTLSPLTRGADANGVLIP